METFNRSTTARVGRAVATCATLALLITVSACSVTRKTVEPSPRPTPMAAAVQALDDLPDLPTDDIRYHFLPVGPGMCRVIECPGLGAEPMVVDCGALQSGHGDDDYTRAAVVDYVRHVVGARRTIVAISHPDTDHSAYLPDVFPDPAAVRRVVYGGVRDNYPLHVRTWMSTLETAGVPVTGGFPAGFSNGGQPVPELACGAAPTNILTVNSGWTANDNSLVLRIRHGSFSVVLPGDATAATQDQAIANYPFPALVSTLVSGSHHGADTHGSNDTAWANAVQPNILVFEAGLRFHHPRCAAAERYIGAGRLVATQQHPFQCGDSTNWYEHPSWSSAIYNTENVGLIVATSNADVGTLRVTCSHAACGWAPGALSRR